VVPQQKDPKGRVDAGVSGANQPASRQLPMHRPLNQRANVSVFHASGRHGPALRRPAERAVHEARRHALDGRVGEAVPRLLKVLLRPGGTRMLL
jgi:hypothetical protein